MNRWNTGHFKRSDTTLYDTVMVDMKYYTFVKTHRNTKQRVNPNVNYGV